MGLTELLAEQGLIRVGRQIKADPTNPDGARKFVADLRKYAIEADEKADAGMHGRANRLHQNARAARRDADRIEATIKEAK